MSNWTTVEGHLYWKGIRVSARRRELPFLALMLGDPKGLVQFTPLGDHYTLEFYPTGTILVFCVRCHLGLLESAWDIV